MYIIARLIILALYVKFKLRGVPELNSDPNTHYLTLDQMHDHDTFDLYIMYRLRFNKYHFPYPNFSSQVGFTSVQSRLYSPQFHLSLVVL